MGAKGASKDSTRGVSGAVGVSNLGTLRSILYDVGKIDGDRRNMTSQLQQYIGSDPCI